MLVSAAMVLPSVGVVPVAVLLLPVPHLLQPQYAVIVNVPINSPDSVVVTGLVVVTGFVVVDVVEVTTGLIETNLRLYLLAYSSIALAKPGDVDFAKAFSDATWFHITGITPAISESAAELYYPSRLHRLLL